MSEFLLICNGFLIAVILGIAVVVFIAARKLIEAKKILHSIQQVHNELSDSVMKVDGKANEALVRLDHLKTKF